MIDVCSIPRQMEELLGFELVSGWLDSLSPPWKVLECVHLLPAESVFSAFYILGFAFVCCVLDHSLVMEPVPSVHLLIGCFGKLLHAGLNNEERIKRLRGAERKRDHDHWKYSKYHRNICYTSNQGRQSLGCR